MIKPTDLKNTMVNPDALTDREMPASDVPMDALEHDEHKRKRSPADGAFDVDDESIDRGAANDEEEEAT